MCKQPLRKPFSTNLGVHCSVPAVLVMNKEEKMGRSLVGHCSARVLHLDLLQTPQNVALLTQWLLVQQSRMGSAAGRDIPWGTHPAAPLNPWQCQSQRFVALTHQGTCKAPCDCSCSEHTDRNTRAIYS